MSQAANFAVFRQADSPKTGDEVQERNQTLFESLLSSNSGGTEPSYRVPGTFWWDSANSRMKLRNSSAWSSVVTETVAQTMTNKTLVNPVVNGSLTGTAFQTNRYDATLGKLPIHGAFGLGLARGNAEFSLLNDTVVHGDYHFEGTDPARPFENGGSFIVSRYSSNWITQLAFSPVEPAMWLRRTGDQGATWGPWVESYTQANAVGTVSQVGGVPTGALMERGSNANGEYARFADGTQICTHSITIVSGVVSAVGNNFMSDSYGWSFPAAFVNLPAISGHPSTQLTVTWATLGSTATTTASTSFRAMRSTSTAATTGTIEVLAIGRWF